MCLQKGHNFCADLGNDHSGWSRQFPLRKPKGFDQSWDYFKKIVTAESAGNLQEARNILTLDDGNLRQSWFIDHAQNAGEWRHKAFNIDPPEPVMPLDSVKKFDKFLESILSRDNFRCRYCSQTVFSKKKLQVMRNSLGDEYFRIGKTNRTRNGYYLTLCATLDHVLPHSLGGRTNPDTLVTSCWPCNYGKMNWTLDQIGLESPFLREPLPRELLVEELMAPKS